MEVLRKDAHGTGKLSLAVWTMMDMEECSVGESEESEKLRVRDLLFNGIEFMDDFHEGKSLKTPRSSRRGKLKSTAFGRWRVYAEVHMNEARG